MKFMRLADIAGLLLCVLAVSAGSFESRAQQSQPQHAETETGQMSLRRMVGVRAYKGIDVEGENRLIVPGDSLWRILIQEKGLSEKRFRQYVVVIRGLNPQIKKPNVLKVGDNVFIPLRPDEVVEARATLQEPTKTEVSFAAGTTREYRVKRGDHLYQILREQLGIFDERELAVYYALTKDLNPKKRDWDLLEDGEIIRLPTTRGASKVASTANQAAAPSKHPKVKSTGKEIKPKPETASETAKNKAAQSEQRIATQSERRALGPPGKETKEELPKAPRAFPADHAGQLAAQSGDTEVTPAAAELKPAHPTSPEPIPPPPLDYGHRLLARDNLPLIDRVAHALDSETESHGEQVFALTDGSVRVDRSAYPIVYSPKLRQRVVIDPQDNIPASLKKKLSDPSVAAPVLPLTKGGSLQEAVGQLLAQLGYQPLPEDRPVIIQEGGIAYEAKGSWMALAPQESNKPQEILVITLTNRNGEIPQYLRDELARKGVHLEDVLLSSSSAGTSASVNSEAPKFVRQVKYWPREKTELVDAMLLAYGIPFGVLETLPVQLRDGLRVDQRIDRLFNLKGKRTALFFEHLEPEIKSALEEKNEMNVIELDFPSLAPRDLIARMLSELGERASYRQHRFAAGNGNPDRLNISAWGFLVTRHSMFITDREIPEPMQRFFFEKGLDIVYFQ